METNNEGFFHMPEDCHYDLLYWLLRPERFFLPEIQCISNHRTSFRLLLLVVYYFFFLLLKNCFFFRTHLTFFYKFHMVCTSQLIKVWWQTSVQAYSILFDLASFWIASKEIFMWDWNKFCYKPLPNNVEFTSMETKSEKKRRKKKED